MSKKSSIATVAHLISNGLMIEQPCVISSWNVCYHKVSFGFSVQLPMDECPQQKKPNKQTSFCPLLGADGPGVTIKDLVSPSHVEI